MGLTIWCNTEFSDPARSLLIEQTREHRLIWASSRSANVLQAAERDVQIAEADILFGQPALEDCFAYNNVQWIEVTTSGYTRYDTPEFKETFRARGGVFTCAAEVFADPCAQHVLAMMLALGRSLLPSHEAQLTERAWAYEKRRYDSVLLTGQTVLMLGYGAIGRRLTELLAPFGMKLIAVRRQTRSERGVKIISEENLSSALGEADHVVNILPDNASTSGYVNARRLGCCRPQTKFYNVGRGKTVDESALIDALERGKLASAYLDVFTEEPLPPSHRFWTTKNCFVTPHTAGGRRDQDEALVRHFLANLARFTRNAEGMTGRIV